MNRTAAVVVLLALTSCSANDLTECVQSGACDATSLLAVNHKVHKHEAKDVPKVEAKHDVKVEPPKLEAAAAKAAPKAAPKAAAPAAPAAKAAAKAAPQAKAAPAAKEVAKAAPAAKAAAKAAPAATATAKAAPATAAKQDADKSLKALPTKTQNFIKTTIDPKIAMMGTQIVKILDDGLKKILKTADDLKKESDTDNKDIKDKVSGASGETEKAAALQKVVEEKVDAFLKPWQAMLDMLNAAVATTTELLKKSGQGQASGMISGALAPVFKANKVLVDQLKKVKKSVSGFDTMTTKEIGGKLTELEGHLKKVKEATKAFTKSLDSSFGMCLAGMSAVIGSAVPDALKATIQGTFSKLAGVEKHITKEFTDSVENLTKGIKTGIEKTKIEPRKVQEQKSAGHRSSTVVAMAITAVAAGLLGL